MAGLILESTIRCLKCGSESTERMPTEVSLFFCESPACKTLLRPKQGDGCVFCSYGSYGTVPCPPKQVDAWNCGCC